MRAETSPQPCTVTGNDSELQAALARDALAGFDHLLGYVPPSAVLPARQICAVVRLIMQASDAGSAA